MNLIYKGPIADGHVECPKTGQKFPFKRGQTIAVPDAVGTAIKAQDPESWTDATPAKTASKGGE